MHHDLFRIPFTYAFYMSVCYGELGILKSGKPSLEMRDALPDTRGAILKLAAVGDGV